MRIKRITGFMLCLIFILGTVNVFAAAEYDYFFTDRKTNSGKTYAVTRTAAVSGTRAYGIMKFKLSDGAHTSTYTLKTQWASAPSTDQWNNTLSGSSRKINLTLTKSGSCPVTMSLRSTQVSTKQPGEFPGHAGQTGNYINARIPIRISIPPGYRQTGNVKIIREAYYTSASTAAAPKTSESMFQLWEGPDDATAYEQVSADFGWANSGSSNLDVDLMMCVSTYNMDLTGKKDTLINGTVSANSYWCFQDSSNTYPGFEMNFTNVSQVTFNANGGYMDYWDGDPAAVSVSVAYGTTDYASHGGLNSSYVKRTGYTMTGFYDSDGVKVYNADGTCVKGNKYRTDSGTWKYAGTPVFYAHWSANNYNVVFDPAGGKLDNNGNWGSDRNTLNSHTCTVTYDAPSYSSNGKAVRTGYTFDGWYTRAESGSGSVKVYDSSGAAVNGTYWSGSGNGAKWKYAGGLTLYAHWTEAASNYRVMFAVGKSKTASPSAGSTVQSTASKYGVLSNVKGEGFQYEVFSGKVPDSTANSNNALKLQDGIWLTRSRTFTSGVTASYQHIDSSGAAAR